VTLPEIRERNREYKLQPEGSTLRTFKEVNVMKYGIMDAMLGENGERLFETAQKIGFDGLELDCSSEDNPIWSQKGRKELKKLGILHGVEISSICLSILKNYGLANTDTKKRDFARRLVTRAIPVAADIGAKVLLLPFFAPAAEITSEEEISNTIKELKNCRSIAEDHGITLGLETTLSAKKILEIVEAVNSNYVKVYYDVGNAVGLGYDPAKELRELGSKIAQVHIKDKVIRGEKVVTCKFLGEGNVDFVSVKKALKEIRYEGYLILELPVPPFNATDDLPKIAARNLEYLKKLMKM